MMPVTTEEAIAGLRILVAVAKADGRIDPAERATLAEALHEAPLPEGTTVDSLLSGDAPLADALAAVKSEAAREDVFKAAYAMAHADGACDPNEQALLDRLRVAWNVPEAKAKLMARVFAEPHAADPLHESLAHDRPGRESSVTEDILHRSLVSAVLGAFPVPGLAIITDLAVVAVQLEMVQRIGAHFDYRVDRDLAKSLLYGLGLGTGARLAVNNLMKLVPGWGSAFGAVSSFATTFALGKVLEQYFREGGEGDTSGMRGKFEEARKDARAAYKDHEAEVHGIRREKAGKLVGLARDFEAGKMTRAEYERAVAALSAP